MRFYVTHKQNIEVYNSNLHAHLMNTKYKLYYQETGVRGQFRLGGLRSVARIFYPLLARKSSGFARILHDFFCPNMAIWKILGSGLAARPPPRKPIKKVLQNGI